MSDDKKHVAAFTKADEPHVLAVKIEPKTERQERWDRERTDYRVWRFNPDGESKGHWIPAVCVLDENGGPLTQAIYGNILREAYVVGHTPLPGARLTGTLLNAPRGVGAKFPRSDSEGFARWTLDRLSGAAIVAILYEGEANGWEFSNGYEVLITPDEFTIYAPRKKLVRIAP